MACFDTMGPLHRARRCAEKNGIEHLKNAGFGKMLVLVKWTGCHEGIEVRFQDLDGCDKHPVRRLVFCVVVDSSDSNFRHDKLFWSLQF